MYEDNFPLILVKFSFWVSKSGLDFFKKKYILLFTVLSHISQRNSIGVYAFPLSSILSSQ